MAPAASGILFCNSYAVQTSVLCMRAHQAKAKQRVRPAVRRSSPSRRQPQQPQLTLCSWRPQLQPRPLRRRQPHHSRRRRPRPSLSAPTTRVQRSPLGLSRRRSRAPPLRRRAGRTGRLRLLRQLLRAAQPSAGQQCLAQLPAGRRRSCAGGLVRQSVPRLSCKGRYTQPGSLSLP